MTYSYTNTITDYLNKQYNVLACDKKDDNSNYFTIDEIKKCSRKEIDIVGTLYIYCCNYEDLIRKVIPLQGYTTLTIENLEDDGDLWLKVKFNTSIPIDTSIGQGVIKLVAVTINDEETDITIPPTNTK